MVAPAAADYADLDPGLLADEPLPRAWTLPSAWYREPRFDALDRAAVFHRHWQLVGHVSQVAEAGAHLVQEIAGEPVLVVRDNEGTLRAFYNVCRHRGGPLALEDGCARMLTCKYHGWVYRLDGTLRGVPHWDRVELFDPGEFGLRPVHVDVHDGLVFVHLGDAPGPLAAWVGPLQERMPVPLAGFQFAHRATYDVACNWKVYVDNFLEGYHIPHVHPELMKLYRFQDYTTELFPHASLQSSPLSGEDDLYSNGAGGTAFYWHLFPNAMLNVLPGRLQTNLVLPLGPERCRVIFQYYYTDTTSERARRLIEADHDYSDHVQAEDVAICERVQVGLGSRAYDRGRFSVAFEGAVHHFQSGVRAAYRSWLAAPPA